MDSTSVSMNPNSKGVTTATNMSNTAVTRSHDRKNSESRSITPPDAMNAPHVCASFGRAEYFVSSPQSAPATNAPPSAAPFSWNERFLVFVFLVFFPSVASSSSSRSHSLPSRFVESEANAPASSALPPEPRVRLASDSTRRNDRLSL